MEANTQSQVNVDERKLWLKCQTFYGTSATKFMCSKCYKDEFGSPPPNPSGKFSKINYLLDVKMEEEKASKQKEEEKQPSKPVQVCLCLI